MGEINFKSNSIRETFEKDPIEFYKQTIFKAFENGRLNGMEFIAFMDKLFELYDCGEKRCKCDNECR